MNNDRDLMQEALNALTYVGDKAIYSDIIDALRARLEKPEREWVSLTEKEHTELAIECGCLSVDWVFYGAAVEAKLKEKNT